VDGTSVSISSSADTGPAPPLRKYSLVEESSQKRLVVDQGNLAAWEADYGHADSLLIDAAENYANAFRIHPDGGKIMFPWAVTLFAKAALLAKREDHSADLLCKQLEGCAARLLYHCSDSEKGAANAGVERQDPLRTMPKSGGDVSHRAADQTLTSTVLVDIYNAIGGCYHPSTSQLLLNDFGIPVNARKDPLLDLLNLMTIATKDLALVQCHLSTLIEQWGQHTKAPQIKPGSPIPPELLAVFVRWDRVFTSVLSNSREEISTIESSIFLRCADDIAWLTFSLLKLHHQSHYSGSHAPTHESESIPHDSCTNSVASADENNNNIINSSSILKNPGLSAPSSDGVGHDRWDAFAAHVTSGDRETITADLEGLVEQHQCKLLTLPIWVLHSLAFAIRAYELARKHSSRSMPALTDPQKPDATQTPMYTLSYVGEGRLWLGLAEDMLFNTLEGKQWKTDSMRSVLASLAMVGNHHGSGGRRRPSVSQVTLASPRSQVSAEQCLVLSPDMQHAIQMAIGAFQFALQFDADVATFPLAICHGYQNDTNKCLRMLESVAAAGHVSVRDLTVEHPAFACIRREENAAGVFKRILRATRRRNTSLTQSDAPKTLS